METTNNTARTAQTETLNEVLIRLGFIEPVSATTTTDERTVEMLTCIQRWTYKWYRLICEHYDWLVVMQCMQDHGLFKSNQKRPPLAEFVRWLESHQVPCVLTQYSTYHLSMAQRAIRDARYPWTEVMWEPNIVKRWRVLYQFLDAILPYADNKHLV